MGPKKAPRTRHSSGVPVSPSELPPSDLPTHRDVLGKVLLEQETHPDDSLEDVFEMVVGAVVDMFKKVNSNLVLISERSLKKKVEDIYCLMRKAIKNKFKGKDSKIFDKKLDTLFDVIVCKCNILVCSDPKVDCDGCEKEVHILCKCDKDKKIPINELLFIRDQRLRVNGAPGNYQIGAKDKKEEKKMDKKAEKNKKEKERAAKEEERKEKEFEVVDDLNDGDKCEQDFVNPEVNLNDEGDEILEEDDYLKDEEKKLKTRNMKPLRNMAKEAVRWGVSP